MPEPGDRIAVAIEADELRQSVATALDDTVPVPVDPTGSLAGLGGILTLATPSVVVIGDDIGNRPFAATRSRTAVPMIALVGLSENPDRCLIDNVDTVVEHGDEPGARGGAYQSDATIERVVDAVERALGSGSQASTNAPARGPGTDPEPGPGAADAPADDAGASAGDGSTGTDGRTDDTGNSPTQSTADRDSTPDAAPFRANGGVTNSDPDEGAAVGPDSVTEPDRGDDPRTASIAELPTETVAETAQTGPYIATGALRDASLSGTVVIGASTGGPGVLTSVLSALPVETDLRVLLVQHLRDPIVPQFADRIDDVTGFDVAVATDGGTVSPGEVAIARGNSHLVVDRDLGDDLRLRCVEGPRRNDVRPAADETMESAAAAVDGPLVGVLLTGIGVDGAEGLQAIKRAGGHTIAQDEATSNIFGMPAAAIESGAVDDVLPGDRIANGIVEAVVDQ